MRVISGSARGTKLISVDNKDTRPTLDRVKESLFNIISSRINEESSVLDLFAGSGAIGIEFLSRGVKKAVFVDSQKEAIQIISKNITKTHLERKSEILNNDYKNVLNEIKEKFSFIYLDPPYKENLTIEALKLIEKNNLLEDDGLIIIETDEPKRDQEEIESCKIKYKISDIRKYGRATLIFLK